MRRFAFPLLFVVAACTGGGASDGSPSSSNPASTTGVGTLPDAPNWADAIVGDGEILGATDGVQADSPPSSGDTSVVVDGPSAGTTGSGTSLPSGSGAGSSGSSGTSGTSGESSSGGGASSSGGTSGFSSSSGGGLPSSSSSSSGSIPPSAQPNQDDPYASLLTAGAWDDNRNFSFFSAYRTNLLQSPNDGYLNLSADETLGSRTAFGGAQAPKTTLDVSLMIDTTGSMDDEIAYLQREFTSLVSTIEAKYPSAQQRWSLVLYKDKHDPYIVKWFDFRTDTANLQTKLMTASAGGGGDFPESPEQALGVAHRLSWRHTADTARLLFWVADAPHHDEDTPAMTTAVKAARDKGIHVYPVASSGIDAFTEYTMRSTAQITGGRYLFLTDDSGIGDSHEVPTLPCYFVTKLSQAILRMVDVELTGAYREPAANEILRTGGDPQSGVCVASPGTTVQIY